MADTTTTRSSAGVIVRRAEKGDKTAVLEINRSVYDGLDYLPYLYDSLITDPNYTYYVAEVEGVVAAFYGVCLIDGGKTLMTRSGRVKASHEKRGLLKEILQVVYRDFTPLYHVTPALKMATAMGNTSALVNNEGFRKISRLLWTRKQASFSFGSDMSTPPASSPQDEARSRDLVKVLPQEAFVQFVDRLTATERQYLFPKGLFTLFSWHFQLAELGASKAVWGKWDPFFTVASSLLLKDANSNTAAREAGQPQKVSGKRHESSTGLLFAAMAYLSNSGIIFLVDVFGDVTCRADITTHIIQLVDWIKRRSSESDVTYSRNDVTCSRNDVTRDRTCVPVRVFFYTNTEAEEMLLSQTLAVYGFHRKDFNMTEMHYFWQDFDTLKPS